MLKKIFQKLKFLKRNKSELSSEIDHNVNDQDKKEEEKKNKKDTNTPDDIYPLW